MTLKQLREQMEDVEVKLDALTDEVEQKLKGALSRLEAAEKKLAVFEQDVVRAQRVLSKLVVHKHLPTGEPAVSFDDL